MTNHRIHILGASGSGTTTLGALLAVRLGIPHFDTDDYFWVKTEIPFTRQREVNDRLKLLIADLQGHPSWVLSGSLCGWGDPVIPMFTLAVFLWLPHELRMERLRKREISRYGLEAISPGGWFHEHHQEFIDWAEKYDTAGINMRSKDLHELWLGRLACKTLRLEQPLSVVELAETVEKALESITP
jgi:adenylate kinase family enzyme